MSGRKDNGSSDLSPSLDDGLKTAAPGELPLAEEGEPQPPFRCWGRYRIAGYLGSGGMGRVFEAFDTVLKRGVAIKFPNRPDPLLLREARAQARVDHEHICKIYEVDEAEGHPFIAMQLIRGQTLTRAAAHMALEQKLLLVGQVADAVHAAHGQGLIHRDLKPGNIMVEEGEAGRFKPFVLDFGLARQEKDGTATMAGTPGFMAPEQVSGAPANLDRRTDVFALGAVLFALVTGRPPFQGEHRREIPDATARQTAPSAAALNATLPRDLDWIIRKCLEKNPGARYASARALADDLRRFLNGEPVTARPSGLWYRLGKKARKHKLAVAALAMTVFVAVWGGGQAWYASRRERMAREFTAVVKDIEALTRHSQMAPLHDLDPDRARLEAEMRSIREYADRAGEMGRALGAHALGMGFLAQGRPEEARTHLERAWNEGYREPETAFALGKAYVELFREKSPAIHLLEEAEDRDLARKDLERQYRDPAMAWMAKARGTPQISTEYGRALVSYAGGDYHAALATLESADNLPSWFHERYRLAGDIYRDQAAASHASGHVEKARQLFAEASKAYDAAIAIAPSDPSVYKARVTSLFYLMDMELFTGADTETLLQEGFSFLEKLRTLVPNDGESSLLEADLHSVAAQKLQLSGEDPTSRWERAAQAAETALVAGWHPSRTQRELGRIYWRLAECLNDRKRDPRDWIDRAVSALMAVDTADRDDDFYNTLARAFKTRAQWQTRTGQPAVEDYRAAIDAYRQAVRRRPEALKHYSGLANCLMGFAALEECPRPEEYLEEAVENLEKAAGLNPNHPVLHYQLGLARYRLARGADPLGWRLDPDGAAKALAHYSRALELNPKLAVFYNAVGWIYVLQARQAWEEGLDPGPLFQKAVDTYDRGLEIAPNTRLLHQNLAWAYFFRGKFAIREGREPGEDLHLAMDHSERALAVGDALEALLCKGSVLRLQAEHVFNRNRDPAPELEGAARAFEEILSINPEFPEAHRSLGRLFTLEARNAIGVGDDPKDAFSRSGQSLAKALALLPDHPDFLFAEARRIYYQALWSRPEGEEGNPKPGIELTEKALSLRPGSAEILALHAALLLLQAGERTSERERAIALGREAIEINPHLAYEWQGVFSPKS